MTDDIDAWILHGVQILETFLYVPAVVRPEIKPGLALPEKLGTVKPALNRPFPRVPVVGLGA